MHTPMKRGIKLGSQPAAVSSLDDWFQACTLYRTEYKHMKQSAFFKSAFERDDWRKMANVWAFVEDDPVVLDAEVDAELGIDGEGPGDAGPGDEDDEVEAAVVVTPDEGNVGRKRKPTIGVAELLDVEQCIEQLRVFNTTHKLPSDVAIHIDRYAYLLRRYQAGPTKFNPSLNAYFKSI